MGGRGGKKTEKGQGRREREEEEGRERRGEGYVDSCKYNVYMHG